MLPLKFKGHITGKSKILVALYFMLITKLHIPSAGVKLVHRLYLFEKSNSIPGVMPQTP